MQTVPLAGLAFGQSRAVGSSQNLQGARSGLPLRAQRPAQSLRASARRHRATIFASATVDAAAAAQAAAGTAGSTDLLFWMASKNVPTPLIAPSSNGGAVTTRMVQEGEVMLEVHESLAITTVDVQNHPVASKLAEGRGELVGLALWIIAERALGAKSEWAPMLAALPRTTNNPMLWSAADRELLKGSPARASADERAAALQSEWEALEPLIKADPSAYPPSTWTLAAFGDALAVALRCAVWLPAAGIFALIPLADQVTRRAAGPLGEGPTAFMDFDAARGSVVLIADRQHNQGDLVVAVDGLGRSNADLLLTEGEVDPGFPGDYLLWEASLLQADRLFMAKKTVLDQQGLSADNQAFPVYADRFPQQLLSFMRLARCAEANDLMKVRFDRDSQVSQLNEYEVLQLMLSDVRDRLAAYGGNLEDDVKQLQDSAKLRPQEVLAAKLRLAEKQILAATMDAVRRRLAPIRGIPTKQGMQRQDADLFEIFDTLENIQSKPMEMLRDMLGWDEDGKPKPPKSGCS